MTRKEAFAEIDRLQNEYIDELISYINAPEYLSMKNINFTSATGTGKTKMMSKLINRLPEYYFIITTLSKGQLHIQIRDNIERDCHQNNFTVYGSADYRINSKLDAEDIINRIPKNTNCIWLRDEGHIRTSRFDELLVNVCYKVVNFSATNVHSDIQCNFAQTMMLRTVNQINGTPEDAILKLIEVKTAHSGVYGYNPCAIFRCVSGDTKLYNKIVRLCKKYNLKYIDITEETYIMAELCEDDNEYDVIINKFKIVEGIDIRRAHVLYMDNQPENNATTIQVIGRCRRNALLYRDDIDILADKNAELLKATRECFVFYNVERMKISTDTEGELQYAFCNYVSCESLKAGTEIEVKNGQLMNGLHVVELNGRTGKFEIKQDKETGFNIVEPLTDFYMRIVQESNDNYVYTKDLKKIHVDKIKFLPLRDKGRRYNYEIGEYETYDVEPYYYLADTKYVVNDVEGEICNDILRVFEATAKKYTREYITSKIGCKCIRQKKFEELNVDFWAIEQMVHEYLDARKSQKGYKQFCILLKNIEDQSVDLFGFTYTIGEICSKNEILLLMDYCIREKENGASLDTIVNRINHYFTLRRDYFSIIWSTIPGIVDVFKGVHEFTCDYKEMRAYVSNFTKENSRKNGNMQFCEMISKIVSRCEETAPYVGLRTAYNTNELMTIQFCCVKEREHGASCNEIREQLSQILENKYKLVLNLKEREETVFFANKVLQYSYISRIRKDVGDIRFAVNIPYSSEVIVSFDDIEKYFSEIDKMINDLENSPNYWLADLEVAIDSLLKKIAITKQELMDGVIKEVNYDYSSLFETISEAEDYLIRNKYRDIVYMVRKADLSNFICYKPYMKVLNDRESAIIGVDLMKQIRIDDGKVIWAESKTVSSKVGNYNKFNSFISIKYANELNEANSQYFGGKNNFNLDKRCNSMIGYCVEYYSKYLVYGEKYLDKYIKLALRETSCRNVKDYIIVRACMIKYREIMIRCFGTGTAKFIKSIAANSLQNPEYEYFVNLIIELGTKTAKYVKNVLYSDVEPEDNIDGNLSINHISGLADYITDDTILDVKVRNNIDEKCVRQVLAYHYLSTKRTDLKIKRVIVYDAVSDRAVVVNISG